MRVRKVVVILALLLAAVGVIVWVGQRGSADGDLVYSGTIEATDIGLAFQTSGRVREVLAQEGMRVDKGAVLARLDDAELASRVLMAKANLERAERLAEQLATSLEVMKSVLPQDLRRAWAVLDRARSAEREARRNKERYERLYAEGVVSEKERDAYRLGHDTALSAVREAEAARIQAEAALEKIEATKKELEAAKAQVLSSRSSLEQATIQLGYATLVSPVTGMVTSRNVEPGEVVNPSREAITVTDLSRVDLKIFVEETAIAKVRPGARVEVTVDSFPGKVYHGVVSYVSPEAEFTPKFIQTRKERVKLVYLVKVSLENPNYELKTGMPADARIR